MPQISQAKFIHEDAQFKNLVIQVADAKKISPAIVEKDYYLMHCLCGLKKQGFNFYLKGGTSLSKGYAVINRFSEDVDILIDPIPLYTENVCQNTKNQTKPAQIESRKNFFQWLERSISIKNIAVEMDHSFDDKDGKERNAGFRLQYRSFFEIEESLKPGVLLEVGFDNVTPNEPRIITSWLYEAIEAAGHIDSYIDNKAVDILCFDPRYTFVEKLQAISTKYRNFAEEKNLKPRDFLRHYSDVYNLLSRDDVQTFLGTKDYVAYKNTRFRAQDEKNLQINEAFLLSDSKIRTIFEDEYAITRPLYYSVQPTLTEILQRISSFLEKM